MGKCSSTVVLFRIHFLQMDQRPYPGPPLLFHIRMSVLFVLLWAIDCVMFLIAAEHTLTNGVGGMVLFASEVRRSNHAVCSLFKRNSRLFDVYRSMPS